MGAAGGPGPAWRGLEPGTQDHTGTWSTGNSLWLGFLSVLPLPWPQKGLGEFHPGPFLGLQGEWLCPARLLLGDCLEKQQKLEGQVGEAGGH